MSEEKHLLERGLPAKNENAVCQNNRVDSFAGKPRSNENVLSDPKIPLWFGLIQNSSATENH